MKKNLIKILCSAFILALILPSCSRGLSESEAGAYEKIQRILLSMKSYQADGTVTYVSNKKSHTYNVKQQCRMTGEYRIEVTGPEAVSGNVTIFDGKIISQFNNRISGKISIGTTEAAERSEILFTSFVRNYLKSNEVSVSVANLDESTYTVFEAGISGEHPYLAAEKVWVNNTTLRPMKLVIYDPDGVERIIVSYDSFEYNVRLDDEIFKTE